MNETVGKQLRQAREARKISLEQIAQATHIRLHYLQAIEAGKFDALPSQAQGRGFLRAYASYVGLNPDEVLASFTGKTTTEPPPQETTRSTSQSDGDTYQAEAIFNELGQRLSHQRDLLGLSLDDVERHTHLRVHYLQALEAGNLKDLPSPVQGRGMLSNYASFLGLDPEPLLLLFAEGLQELLAARRAFQRKGRPSATRKRRNRPSFLRIFPLDYILGGLVVVALLAFIVWGGMRISRLRSSNPSQTPLSSAPSIAEVLSVTNTLTPSPSPAVGLLTPGAQETQPLPTPKPGGADTTSTPGTTPAGNATPTQPIAIPTSGNAALQVYVIIQERAWMRVIVDGKLEFEGRVVSGSAYSFSGDKRIEVLTGNGAALQIYFNQTDLGVMGLYGEVIYRIFTLQGVFTPTATITLTPLPTATKTPQPTTEP